MEWKWNDVLISRPVKTVRLAVVVVLDHPKPNKEGSGSLFLQLYYLSLCFSKIDHEKWIPDK